MFFVPCRILFEGGPHDGQFAEREHLPEHHLIVAMGREWREGFYDFHEPRQPMLAAEYDWRTTTILNESGKPVILLRYRFLTYHAQAIPNCSLTPIRRRRMHWWGRLASWVRRDTNLQKYSSYRGENLARRKPQRSKDYFSRPSN